MLENYQVFSAKKMNTYEKLLFCSRENNDKFAENDIYLQKEKAQYISSLTTKHKAFLPWELLNEKFVLIKTRKKNAEEKESKSKKKVEEIEKIDIISDKNEKKSEIVDESSMESDSVGFFPYNFLIHIKIYSQSVNLFSKMMEIISLISLRKEERNIKSISLSF